MLRLADGEETAVAAPVTAPPAQAQPALAAEDDEAGHIAAIEVLPEGAERNDRVLALLVGVLHRVGQQFAQRRGTEAFLVHLLHGVVRGHVAAEMKQLDRERRLARLVRLVREVLLDDVVVLPVERAVLDGFGEHLRVVDVEGFAAVGHHDAALGHDDLRELARERLVLQDAPQIVVVAASIQNRVDQGLEQFERHAKTTQKFTLRTSHDEPHLPVAYPLPRSPDRGLRLAISAHSLAAVIKFTHF